MAMKLLKPKARWAEKGMSSNCWTAGHTRGLTLNPYQSKIVMGGTIPMDEWLDECIADAEDVGYAQFLPDLVHVTQRAGAACCPNATHPDYRERRWVDMADEAAAVLYCANISYDHLLALVQCNPAYLGIDGIYAAGDDPTLSTWVFANLYWIERHDLRAFLKNYLLGLGVAIFLATPKSKRREFLLNMT